MNIVLNKPDSVFALIEKIAATPSKLEKEALIKQGGSSPLFMRVCRAAYDPFTTYGMRALPEKTVGIAPGMNTLTEEWVWELLSQLASRQLAGGEAWAAVQKAVDFLDAPSSELLRRIIRGDLRASFGTDTINRVFPKTFPDFPYMRCSLPDKSNMPKWPWGVGIISQEKADGMFANVNLDKTSLWITSRQGSPISIEKLPRLATALANTLAVGSQTHGELTVYKDGKLMPREEGNGILNSIIQGGDLPDGHEVRFDAWDQIPLAEVKPKGKYSVPYIKRLQTLIMQVSRGRAASGDTKLVLGIIPTKIVRSKAEAYEHYRAVLREGKEGTICKHPDAIWQDGTSKDQVKLKLTVPVELEVVGIVPGKVGTKNEGRPGSLDCRTADRLLATDVTVKNEEMRAAIERDPTSWIGSIMTVVANSVMEPSKDGDPCSLFLPRFAEATPRVDKSTADTLEQVRDQFRNAVETA